jgi:hypothetical protein
MMRRAVLELKSLHRDAAELGSDEEVLVSRVFFHLRVSGEAPRRLAADVRQRVREDHASTPLEITRPIDYRGPLNYAAFRRCVEAYYRRLVSGATGDRSQARALQARDQIIGAPMNFSFDIPDDPSVW